MMDLEEDEMPAKKIEFFFGDGWMKWKRKRTLLAVASWC